MLCLKGPAYCVFSCQHQRSYR